jgi:K+-sensing histidine kinase KdpD
MWSGRWIRPVATTLAAVSVLTAIFWYTGRTGVCPHDPVFFFLIPVVLVAIRYGTAPALIAVLVSFGCADFFLYSPLYTFNICSRAELGDLSFFSVLAVLAITAVHNLYRPLHSPGRT